MRNGLIDVCVAALFIRIVTDLGAASRSSRLRLKLNSSGCDVLIGTLFPLIEQIGKKVCWGRGNLWERRFGIHNLELKISSPALFVCQPVCGGARRRRRRSGSQRYSGLVLSLLKAIKE